MDFQKLCSEIFAIDKKIRFVAVYDDHLEKIAGGMRDNMKNLVPEELIKVSVDGAFMRWKNRRNMQDWFGKPLYAFAEYEQVRRYSFYINEREILIVSTERDMKNDQMVDLILKKLR